MHHVLLPLSSLPVYRHAIQIGLLCLELHFSSSNLFLLCTDAHLSKQHFVAARAYKTHQFTAYPPRANSNQLDGASAPRGDGCGTTKQA